MADLDGGRVRVLARYGLRGSDSPSGAHQISINNLEGWLSGLRHWFAKSTYKKIVSWVRIPFPPARKCNGQKNYVKERTSWWSPPEDRIALLSETERRARCALFLFDRPIFFLFPPAVQPLDGSRFLSWEIRRQLKELLESLTNKRKKP